MESEEDLGLHRCPRRLSRGSGVGFAEFEMDSFSEGESRKSPVESLDDRMDESSVEDLKTRNSEDIVTTVLHAEDDPSLNALTFRTWFIGIGLGIFGAIVDTMYHFRPLTLDISKVFLALAAYVISTFMERSIPRGGFIGRWLNPHPFNSKEHAAIIIMASASTQVALAVQVIAVQRLYYNNAPSTALSILIVISSQCLGYGFAGLLRRVLVYPSKMLWPVLLPVNTLLETFHRNHQEAKPRRRFLYWVFAAIFVWQVLPEYVMPILTGVSVFCLANQNNLVFTTIFGGTNPNEGLGLLSLGLDWQLITSQPLWYPLQTLTNNFIGYIICIVLFAGVYYGNVWRARDFPFLSQLLFSGSSEGSDYVLYNGTAILNQQNSLNSAVLERQGTPYFSGTYATSILTNNLYITSTIVHLLLWNWNDVKKAWAFLHPENLRRLISLKFWTSNPEVVDHDEVDNNAHYQFMRAYKECPNWWYAATLVISTIIGLVCIYAAKTTLPWYGFLVSILVASICTLFFGAQAALTGYQGNVQPLMQLLGGYIHPGQPTANLYFTLFGQGTVIQGINLTQNLKLGQYAKLPPRITFTAQLTGTIVGSIISYIVMTEITKDQRAILLTPRGTLVWSGHNTQKLHAQTTAFGTLSTALFTHGSRYAALPLSLLIGLALPLPTYLLGRHLHRAFTLLNTPLVLAYAGILAAVPASSAMLAYFAVGFGSQFWLRRYRPGWFVGYNYLAAAALEGGAQAVGLVVAFAFKGAGGAEVRVPAYWGNNRGGNADRCARGPGLGGG
ncbi:hypothetical protein SLS56_005832 [Neofusicoccum ribis]|uniref:OPT superfamily oligopeptide transporter n=1 Tax=Neofusicoccum ribis TaxID=45134 RepID=A0ABR3SSK0_9PEZI